MAPQGWALRGESSHRERMSTSVCPVQISPATDEAILVVGRGALAPARRIIPGSFVYARTVTFTYSVISTAA